MLLKIYIRNYAIIDDLTVEFNPHFNIITGETGAGKSIVMGALGLILGKRADSSVLYNTTEKCIVEATFHVKNNPEINKLLLESDLDETDQTLLVRREIGSNGKSRSFINDTPVTLVTLKSFADKLVDLHQQFDTMELGDNNFQRTVIDALAQHTDILNDYYKLFATYTSNKRKLDSLVASQQNANKELDYFKYLYSELEEAGFAENEIEELEAEQKLLESAESIKQILDTISYNFQEGEQPMLQQIKSSIQQLNVIKNVHESINDLTERLNSVHIELKDIAGEVDSINSNVHMDGGRLEIVNERLNQAYKLLKKHSVATTAELLNIKNNLHEQLQSVLNIEDTIKELEILVNENHMQAGKTAHVISAKRKSITGKFEENVQELLAKVGMPNARIKVAITLAKELNNYGTDEIQFLFDANKSNRFEPLEKVASGGELSRLMLSIKSIVATNMQMPTLIFDEIDTGISGDAANQAGNIMRQLAMHHQVISITHQPQIAAKATAHYFVYKQEIDGKIHSRVKLLDTDGRVKAIANMLSGSQHTESAMQIAREMMNN